MHVAYISHFDVCICLRGASVEVSSQIICDNSMCFVIIKKGEIVGPKAISPSCDEPLYGQIYFMISLLSLGSYVSLYFC